MAVIETTDTFLLVNKSNRPLTFRYNSKEYKIGPNKKKFVPFQIIEVYFGDPRTTTFKQHFKDNNMPHFLDTRESELKRLCTLYGVHEQPHLLADVVPKVEVYTADNEQLFPPAFDPDGRHKYGHPEDVTSSEDIRSELERVRAMQERLETALEQTERIGGDNDGTAVSEDAPPINA